MDPKTILITGASSELIEELIKINPEYRYILTDIKEPEYSVGNVDSKFFKVDITDFNALKELLKSLNFTFDSLVNVPSYNSRKNIKDVDIEEIKKTYDVKLLGYTYSIKAILPYLNTKASIVNISSVHSHRTYANMSFYAAANAGLNALGRSLAIDLKGKARVNTVLPGGFLTKQYKEDNSDWESKWNKGQILHPKQVAEVVSYLISDTSNGINGAEIVVDGGVSTLKASSRDW